MLTFIKFAVLPPFANILVALAGLVMIRRWPRTGWSLIAFSTLCLYLLSIPSTMPLLSIGLEDHGVPTMEEASRAEVIVVLGGGRETDAPQWKGRDTVAEAPLARLAEAARWHRRTGLPLLLTGGRNGMDDAESEAQLMARMLEEAFGIQARWLEHESRDTRENAEFSARILDAGSMETILLVTHAAHLTRAIPEFEKRGFDVIPAPMGFASSGSGGELSLLPRATYLEQNTRLVYEHIGRLYYWLTE
ncbi:YdcF family protein [Marinobacter bryozoorum]|uniref:YdcF family protein n=1 Tax=Marinobacter bryozoorum TaxID=256324 RepID=UPI002005547A|nr:YdcF family protein [Marinobacter bryozoorum]MCK7542589.1 YdcF family protein [Marinobacter bryozoorum]